MKARTYILISLFAIGTMAIVLIGLHLHSRTVPQTAFETKRTYWIDRIQHVGGMSAYAEFAVSVASSTAGEQHAKAHIFGSALYAAEGLNGISVCDERFAQGCFHEFMGEAVRAHGISIVPTLAKECAAAIAPNSMFCMHGIGHGLIALFGYEEQDLKEALSQCDTIAVQDPLKGCYTGAFMEYDLRLVQNEGVVSAQPLTDTNAETPCNDPSLSSASRWTCYYARVQWWYVAFLDQGLSPYDAMARSAALCATITDVSGRDTCLHGFGHNIPSATDYNVSESIRFCTGILQSPSEQLICRAETANLMYLENMPASALAMCAGYSGDESAYCVAYATHAQQVDITMKVPDVR